jgi:diacylglycerol kinase (ATP)
MSDAAKDVTVDPGRPQKDSPELESPHKGKTGLKRVLKATVYSFDGLKSAWKHEDAFRQEAILASWMIPVTFLLTQNNLARAMMIASILLVLIVELVNSAIEAAVDRISLENHHLAKRAKDIGSAAVFVSLINVVLVWGLSLWPWSDLLNVVYRIQALF